MMGQNRCLFVLDNSVESISVLVSRTLATAMLVLLSTLII